MKFRTALLPLCLTALLPLQAQAERGLQPRDLVSLTRVSSPTLSPDGGRLVFVERTVDLEGDASGTALYLRDLRTRDLRPPQRITPEGWAVNSPTFSPDGATLYFLSGKHGTQQVYAMPATGGEPRQVTDFALDIGSYQLSPDGTRVAFSADVFTDCAGEADVFACSKARLDGHEASKVSGVTYDQLFVRHWDTWNDGRLSRLYVAPVSGEGAAATTSATAVSQALDGDIPAKPFGGAEDYAWAPDGGSLVASVRVAGAAAPWSTNFDLYRLDPAGARAPVNLTEANPAWDTGPVFSADGGTLFYRAMQRPGFEADRYAIMALDLASGQAREIAPDWDRSPSSLAVSADGQALYAAAQDTGEYPLFRIDIASGDVTRLIGEGSVSSFDVAGQTLAVARNTMRSGDVIYTTTADATELRAITPDAAERLPDVRMGDYEQFTFRGWNGNTVHGYVVKPWNYREGEQYPVAFLIHGGPQGSFGDGWSYRWNPQTYAGQGWAVVMIDFHGSTGYGQDFTDAISQHWGDRPLEDLQKGWAAALRDYDFLDGDRACALGASYGGYMVNWIASQWNAPWKCLVNHNGVFDTRSMGLVTEELWFTEWEHGGTVYDNPDGYERFNPARHIGEWRVPMLVVAGQNDFRVPVDQSLSTFTALQRQGIPSRLMYFPDENHWVLKPHNSVYWHETVNDWLRHYFAN
ncbi:alpha/beta hydrolase family protein [Luteimonas abyssi]|uniref:S9 family peptidase n=1 Tax=Luteimonas abyssi TaxID=1247514 RepID=UPI000737BF7D|nr:S9 family peptidase [Luteimonas abyssi]